MKINKSILMKALRRKRKIDIVLFITSLFTLTTLFTISAQCQAVKSDYSVVDNFTDSVAKDYLKGILAKDSIGEFVIDNNGKSINVKNYYVYLSFSLKYGGKSDTLDSIKIFNFGCHCEDVPSTSLMLLMYTLNGQRNQLVLGRDALSRDLPRLESFFTSVDDLVKEKFKTEILDLFVKRKQGVFQTPLYIH